MPNDYEALLAFCAEIAPDLEGRAAIPTAAVVVVEWSDETGEKWLTMLSNPDGSKWQTRGLLHEALYFWPIP